MARPTGTKNYVPAKNDGNDRVADRIKEYEDEFEADSLTTIDRAQIARMAKIELAANDATDQLASNPDLTPSQRKALGDTAKSLSMEARQLADALGMSRNKRLSSEQGEQEQFIPKIYAEAKEFIYQHAVCIICPHCRKEEAHVEIPVGTIIYHFAYEGQWKWESICPRCKKKFEITQDNYGDFLFSTINQIKVSERVSLEEIEEGDGDDQEEV